MIEFDLKNYKEAISYFNKSISINPKDATAYHNRGIAKIQIGDKSNGCQDLIKARDLGSEPSNEAIKSLCR